jgi:UDP-galactopyranose mutase
MFDYLVVGAGVAGCVIAERLARVLGLTVLLIGKPHIGRNAYDHYNEHGILVHKYRPHIFHTNSRQYSNISRSSLSGVRTNIVC